MRTELGPTSQIQLKLDEILRVSQDTKISVMNRLGNDGSDLDRLLLQLKISVGRLEAAKRFLATIPQGELQSWYQTHGCAVDLACSECIEAIIRLKLTLE